jgi:hypothetical protein
LVARQAVRSQPQPEPIYYCATGEEMPLTAKEEMKAFWRRTRGTFNRPLVYRIDDDGYAPVIMSLGRTMGE